MKKSSCILRNFYCSLAVLMLIAGVIAFAGVGCDWEVIPKEWTEYNPAELYPDFSYKGLTPSCSDCPMEECDPEFKFFAKGGSSNNLVVFFQGGGACWDSNNCIYSGLTTTNTRVSETVELLVANEEAGNGIFSTIHDNNPFEGWNFVYIPYCTGDIHNGANDYDYPDDLPNIGVPPITGPQYGGVPQTIRHRGKVNFKVVLKWIEDNFPRRGSKRPRKIFVTGSSAGAYGALMNFPDIKDAYRNSKVYCLPDAGNGIMPNEPVDPVFKAPAQERWNFQLPWQVDEFIEGLQGFNDFTTAEMVAAIANNYPNSIIAPYTAAWDNNQTAFLFTMWHVEEPWLWGDYWGNVSATWEEWNEKLYLSTYETANLTTKGKYRYYIGPGYNHTIMRSPFLYSEVSDGVYFVDWLIQLIEAPGSLQNVECADCGEPPL